MTCADRTDFKEVWNRIQRLHQEQLIKSRFLGEENSFYIYRGDTNEILARGVLGYEAAKERANQLRKAQGLPWSVVKFKAERRSNTGTSRTSGGQQRRFGVSPDGRWFTNAYGQRSRVDYAPVVNPSKGRRFRGYYDREGNFHDID
jgi:hypothetical protein